MTNKKILLLIGVSFILVLAFMLAPQKKADAPESNPENAGNNTPVEDCQFVDCHGLDLACSDKVAPMCTMEYQLGDNCRQYAKCESSGGQCQLVVDDKFNICKNCVEACQQKYAPEDLGIWDCEQNCLEN